MLVDIHSLSNSSSFFADVGSGDIEVYWVSDRKQMIIVSGDSVHILSQQSKPAALGM